MIINCDMGEGIGNEKEIMPYIDAANIACGYHAGDEDTMRQVVQYCIQHNVSIGAHPSFYDKTNFGRTEMHLPVSEIYKLVKEQLEIMERVVTSFDSRIQHVKPHGALYNMAAKDEEIARAIAIAVKDFDPGLLYMGLSGSLAISVAEKTGLRIANEVFADRSYQDDGSLTARKEPNAMIEDEEKLLEHVSEMAFEAKVRTVTGRTIPVKAETVCIHGDGPHAVQFARAIYKLLNT
jgi:UPF0271 protein